MKVIVPCVKGQLFCSANSAARHIVGNVTPGGTVNCQTTSLSGCHKQHLCQDLEVRLYYVESMFKMNGHSQTLPIKNQSLCGLVMRQSLISCIAFLKLFGFLFLVF